MARLVPTKQPGADQLDEALGLVESHFRDRPVPRTSSDEDLSALLQQAVRRVSTPTQAEPVRIVRQFACTGGTLICRGLGAQPNTRILSEVDPFNTDHLLRRKAGFTPTDLIQLADSRLHPLDDDLKGEMFLAALDKLYTAATRMGRRLVLREHSHGRFCTTSTWSQRRSVGDIVNQSYLTRTLVTVRHPLDSWLSLNANEWRHFTPFSLEEYSKRYLAFIDDCGDVPVVRYEDFVSEPDRVMREMCEQLDLNLNPSWQTLITAVSLSGDSGRSGLTIAPRERREISIETASDAKNSKTFQRLCKRLGYTSEV